MNLAPSSRDTVALLTPTTWPRPVRGLLLSSGSIKTGLKRAVAQDVKLGRPKIDSATERKVRKQLAKGVGILKVAKSFGLGTGTVQRISKERAMSSRGAQQ